MFASLGVTKCSTPDFWEWKLPGLFCDQDHCPPPPLLGGAGKPAGRSPGEAIENLSDMIHKTLGGGRKNGDGPVKCSLSKHPRRCAQRVKKECEDAQHPKRCIEKIVKDAEGDLEDLEELLEDLIGGSGGGSGGSGGGSSGGGSGGLPGGLPGGLLEGGG